MCDIYERGLFFSSSSKGYGNNLISHLMFEDMKQLFLPKYIRKFSFCLVFSDKEYVITGVEGRSTCCYVIERYCISISFNYTIRTTE